MSALTLSCIIRASYGKKGWSLSETFVTTIRAEQLSPPGRSVRRVGFAGVSSTLWGLTHERGGLRGQEQKNKERFLVGQVLRNFQPRRSRSASGRADFPNLAEMNCRFFLGSKWFSRPRIPHADPIVVSSGRHLQNGAPEPLCEFQGRGPRWASVRAIRKSTGIAEFLHSTVWKRAQNPPPRCCSRDQPKLVIALTDAHRLRSSRKSRGVWPTQYISWHPEESSNRSAYGILGRLNHFETRKNRITQLSSRLAGML